MSNRIALGESAMRLDLTGLTRRSFLQVGAAASCSSVLADQNQDPGDGRAKGKKRGQVHYCGFLGLLRGRRADSRPSR